MTGIEEKTKRTAIASIKNQSSFCDTIHRKMPIVETVETLMPYGKERAPEEEMSLLLLE
jgi:hypothetical protein